MAESIKESKFKIETSALRAYTMIAALALIWMYFHWATSSIFLTPRNLSNLMLQASVTGIIAVGMLMVIIAGQIDLSVGSVLGFTGAVAAIALARWEFGLPAALLLAIITGGLIGLAQGALTAYLNIPAFIVTLGGLLAWRGAVKAITQAETIPISEATFKSIGQSYVSPEVGWILAGAGVLFVLFVAFRRARTRETYGLGEANYAGEMLKSVPSIAAIIVFIYVMNSYAGIPRPVLILLAVALLGVFITNFTTFGRYLYAIGGNADAARLSGINNKQNILKVFALLGALTGVAALIFTARVGSASPEAGTLKELDAIAAVVIGGTLLTGGQGSVLSTLVGVLLLGVIFNLFNLEGQISPWWQLVLRGVILLFVVVVQNRLTKLK